MSRAWQAEREAEREQESIDNAYARGEMTDAQYRSACQDIQREMRYAYEADMEDADARVRDDWGI